MICYNCGSVLGSGRLCLHCGVDVTLYRKIIKTSNLYYNSGLAKAKVRDLSGALADLSRSLEYNKKNTQARNLLGLVYYEMGEVTEALCQWVISKDISSVDNPAEAFINKIQEDKPNLDAMTGAIKSFNQALDSAKHDGEDLAVIQLRRVISQSPRFLKAYQLLSLLLLNEGDNSKASRIIKKGLAIDKGNVALNAYAELAKNKTNQKKNKAYELVEGISDIAGQDVIVPHYMEQSRIKQLFLGGVITLAICLAAYIFLIKPSIDRSTENTLNQNEISYYEKTEDKEAQIQALTTELDKYKSEADANQEAIDKYTGENGSITNYEYILTALTQYWNKEYKAFITTYSKINPDSVSSDSFAKVYKQLGKYIGSDTMMNNMMDVAVSYFKNSKYSDCIKTCQSILKIKSSYVKAIYYTGLCYEAQGDDSKAAPYFRQIVKDYKSSDYYELAKKRVG